MQIKDQDDELELFASDVCKKKVSLVKEVIAGCVRRDLFDKDVFNSFGVITSDRIQSNYLEATSERRRKGTEIVIKEEYLLVPFDENWKNVVITRNNDIIPRNNSFIPVINQQSIVEEKESIEEEFIGQKNLPTDKDEFSILDPPDENTDTGMEKRKSRKKFIAPTLEQVEAYMMKVKGDATKQNSWPEDKIRNLAGKCYDHYSANGWTQGKGKPIVDWEAACRNFIRNEVEGVFSKSTVIITKNEGFVSKNEQKNTFSPRNVTQPAPVQKEPTQEEKEKMAKSFLNDSYQEFLNGKFNVKMLGIGVFESLKQFKLAKLNKIEVDRILLIAKDKRLVFLKTSTDRADMELIKNYNPDSENEKSQIGLIAKRIFVEEIFEVFKKEGKTVIV